MSGYVLKAPGSELDCVLDWRGGYLQPGERLRGDLGWSVSPVSDQNDLQVVTQRHDDSVSQARVRGGVAGRVYMLCAKVSTDQGRELEQQMVVRIAA